MPRRCAGFLDPSVGGTRPCVFAPDGLGGPAQANSSKARHCVLCSLDALAQALDSRAGKGNLVRRLKRWRRLGAPTYEAAFEFGSLLALPLHEQHRLRQKAGEATKLRRQTSWLHKDNQRLTHFLLGKPIPGASPGMSTSSQEYLQRKASSYCDDGRLHRIYMVYRKQEPFANIKSKCQSRTYWRGRLAIVRRKRCAWWKARRTLLAKYLASITRGPPFNSVGLKWAMEEGMLQAGAQVPLPTPHYCQSQATWYLTTTGDSMYFERFREKICPQGQLDSAVCTINNALGREESWIDQGDAQKHLEEKGYEWYRHMIQNGVIFSPLWVSSNLERLGFKLQMWRRQEPEWPPGVTSLLQIRGDRRTYKEYWVALKSCNSEIYLLDSFRSTPVVLSNWKRALEAHPTYALVQL